MTATKADILNHPALKDDFLLKAFLTEADQFKDYVFYAVNIIQRQTLYINAACQSILGYPPHQFVDGGADFFFSITDEAAIPQIIEHQNELLKKLRSPEFSPYEVHIPRFDVVIKNPHKGKINLVCQAVMLTFTTQADPELGLVMLSDHCETSEKNCKELLQQIKMRHNEIYQHPAFSFSHHRSIPIIHVTNERYDLKITQREKEILARLAKGESTHEIANHLNVSINTIETHRRHLLEKFEARNVAELIKKASKVFWLE